MDFLKTNEEAIRKLLQENESDTWIRKMLLGAFPEVRRGFSELEIRLFSILSSISKVEGWLCAK